MLCQTSSPRHVSIASGTRKKGELTCAKKSLPERLFCSPCKKMLNRGMRFKFRPCVQPWVLRYSLCKAEMKSYALIQEYKSWKFSSPSTDRTINLPKRRKTTSFSSPPPSQVTPSAPHFPSFHEVTPLSDSPINMNKDSSCITFSDLFLEADCLSNTSPSDHTLPTPSKKCRGIISISGPEAKIYVAARLRETAYLFDKSSRNLSIPSTLHKMLMHSLTNALNFRDKDDVIYKSSADEDILILRSSTCINNLGPNSASRCAPCSSLKSRVKSKFIRTKVSDEVHRCKKIGLISKNPFHADSTIRRDRIHIRNL